MLTLKLQAKDYELTLVPPPHKLKSNPYPKQSQDQSLFQAEHFRLKSCYFCDHLHFPKIVSIVQELTELLVAHCLDYYLDTVSYFFLTAPKPNWPC